MYNWQQTDWRHFRYEAEKYTSYLLEFIELVGESVGYQNSLSEAGQAETIVTLLVKEALKTSAIEGEMISRADVISSIRKNLGYPTPTLNIKDKRSEGIALLLVQCRATYQEDLSEKMLFQWHQWLMRGNYSVNVGVWRTHLEPMQVISGTVGKEKIHFEAPPSSKVPAEMELFIRWFNDSKPDGPKPILNPLIRAAIAHLYFETIHPFEDGNGRIGRIIAEKALAQNLKRPILMSLSTAIEANKLQYYQALQQAQRSNDLNLWITYFSQTIVAAQRNFIKTISFLLKKAAFFDSHRARLSTSQLKVLGRMLEEDGEFVGGMNAKKYGSIAQVSKATATRHLQDLVDKNILIVHGNARNTNYQVNLEPL
jgi:Fic family protein